MTDITEAGAANNRAARESGHARETSLVRVGANMSAAVIGAVAGFALLGPIAAICGAAIGAFVAQGIRVAYEHHRPGNRV